MLLSQLLSLLKSGLQILIHDIDPTNHLRIFKNNFNHLRQDGQSKRNKKILKNEQYIFFLEKLSKKRIKKVYSKKAKSK